MSLGEARRTAKDALYRKLRAQYEVAIETKDGPKPWVAKP